MHHQKTYMYINFQQNWDSRSVKTVHTNVFANIANCVNLQLQLEFRKINPFPITDNQANFGSNWPNRYQITAKRNC